MLCLIGVFCVLCLLYCQAVNPLFMFSTPLNVFLLRCTQLRPIKYLQMRSVKLIAKLSSNDTFKTTRILPLQSLIDFLISLLIMKSIDDRVPLLIKDLYTFWPNGNNRFRLPCPRLDISKSHTILFSAVMTWNSLHGLGALLAQYQNFKRELGNNLLSKVLLLQFLTNGLHDTYYLFKTQ